MKRSYQRYLVGASLIASIVMSVIVPAIFVRIAFILSLSVILLFMIGDTN